MNKSPEAHGGRESHPVLATFWRPLAKVALAASLSLGLTGSAPPPDTVVVNHPSEMITDDTISVMTANVHGWESVVPGKSVVRAFKDSLREQQIDIVCAQEVNQGSELSQVFEDYNGVFSATKHDFMQPQAGNAVFSTAPIELEEVIDLPNSVTEEKRQALVVRVLTDKGWMWILNTHLSVDPYESARQLRAFERALDKPVDIVCGDFNQEHPRQLASGARLNVGISTLMPYHEQAWVPSGTFPSDNPVRGIDHILSSCPSPNDIMRKTSRTKSIYSDHSSMSAMIYIPNCPNLVSASR